ncbi:RNA polymerase sigma factor [Magnetococcales bacterium HHB-1]
MMRSQPKKDRHKAQQLKKRVLQGDKQVFAEIVRHYYPYVYRFLLKKCHSKTDAEDLTQETFLAARKSLTTFRGDSALSTWLIGIAINMARRHQSRTKNQQEREAPLDKIFTLSDSREDPERSANQRAILKALHQGLHTLNKEQREALVLVSLEGLSYIQAAKAANIEVKVLRTRIFRARKALKTILKRQGKWDLFHP